jgi:hypothetical protein
MSFLKQEYCNECGSQIDIHYNNPIKIFTINNGQLIKNDNEGASYLEFLCSQDLEHDVGRNEKLINWTKEVEYKFYQESKYND